MRRERRHVSKRHLLYLAVSNFGIHGDQARGRFELQASHGLDGFHHSGFNQHGHDADRVAAGHRRIFCLLHDHVACIGFRNGRWKNQVAADGGITAGLAKHAQADMVGVRLDPRFLLEHGAARDVEDSAGDDASRFAAGVRVDGGDHARKSHGVIVNNPRLSKRYTPEVHEKITRRKAGQILGAAAAAQTLASAAPDICFMTAVEMAGLIRKNKLSAREALDAHLKQIERVNQKVNAIVALVIDQAKESARKADEAQAKGAALGSLHGLPIAHKDLMETAGIRTTFGSPVYKDYVPDFDTIPVER